MASALRSTVLECLAHAISHTARHQELSALHHALCRVHADLSAPMRVAIVGKIKAGKSTLMNALLGADIVATGASEMTFNVNWFRYAEQPSATIQFRDGRREPRAFGDLRDLTIRDASKAEFLSSIRHVEVAHPTEMLKRFDLIDTPGLDSVHERDAKNTLDLLGLEADDVDEWTVSAARDADAIVYLFSKNPSERDLDVLQRFHEGVAGMSPVNAVGVLTRIDDYFPQESDPLRRARAIISGLNQKYASLARAVYVTQPICGKLALGAATLTDDEFMILRRLAAVPEALLREFVWSSDPEAFRTSRFAKVSGLPEPSDRAKVERRLGFYGCKVAVDLLASGIEREALQPALVEASGVDALRQIVVSHFGNRALIIKLSSRLHQLIDGVGLQVTTAARGEARDAAASVRAALSEIRAQTHAFEELDVLRRHYAGTLEFTAEETDWMLAITGENGPRAHQKLGVAENTTIRTLRTLAEERLFHFRLRARTTRFGDRATHEAAQTLENSFGILLSQVDEANRLLNPELD